MDDFTQEKKAVRKEFLTRRRALTMEERTAFSQEIVQAFLESSFYKQSKMLFGYLPMEDEVALTPILRQALAEGKRVFVPYLPARGKMHAAEMKSFDDLEDGAFSILTVRDAGKRVYPPDAMDTILVPGTAFTVRGERMGMGGGYYDRYLENPQCIAWRVALAFDCQIAKHLPTEPHDARVDIIFTERRKIEVCK